MSTRRRLLRRSLAGLVISVGITFLLVALFNIPIDRLLVIPTHLLTLSIAVCMARLGAQGLRFHLLVKHCSSVKMSFSEAFTVRSASEFFALTTIPFLADEAVRTWILTEKGEKAFTALWIAFSELIFDVFIAAPISLAAGAFALARGAVGIAAIILTITVIQLSSVVGMLFIIKNGGVGRLVRLAEPLSRMSLFSKRLLDRFRDEVAAVYGATQLFRGRSGKKVVSALIALTVVIMSAPATILYMAYSNYLALSFIDSLYAFHAGNTLGVLPLTVGGSGLTETGIYIFIDNVYDFGSWEAVVIWRIMTYYLTLLFTGATFVIYVSASRKRSG